MRTCFIRPRWLLRLLITVPLVVLLLLNMQLTGQVKDLNAFYNLKQEAKSFVKNKLAMYNIVGDNNISSLTQTVIYSDKSSSSVSSSSSLVFDIVKEHSYNAMIEKLNMTRDELRDKISKENEQPVIRNKHFIDSFIQSSTPSNHTTNSDKRAVYKMPEFLVILIQIHSRLSYLTDLVASLRQVKNIQNTLVVFSHDIYDSDMNAFVQSIDFCSTVQIFYPFSIQLFPDTFPGHDPKDCPKMISKSEALKLKCNNAANPDHYGHYREARVTQIKHHWLWKLNFVFEKLDETSRMSDLHVLLLEEDHFLFPDALHTLRKLSEKIQSDIDVVSLAHFEKSKQNLDNQKLNKYAKAIWHTSMHNTGLMLARPQWKMIKDCSHAFCTYDDYNWDWSLQHISHNCFNLPLVAIYPVYSRVIHMGTCGTHHKKNNCETKENLEKLQKDYIKNNQRFFAESFEFSGVSVAIRRAKKPNGGWSDSRDVHLCKSFFLSNINDEFNRTLSISLEDIVVKN